MDGVTTGTGARRASIRLTAANRDSPLSVAPWAQRWAQTTVKMRKRRNPSEEAGGGLSPIWITNTPSLADRDDSLIFILSTKRVMPIRF